MSRIIRIGTRESELALWQARYIASRLQGAGYDTQIVPVKSDGELDLVTPLYEIGVEGIFTKALDLALLSDRIDLAVHSLKDVPTRLAKGLYMAGIPERGDWRDLLVQKDGSPELPLKSDYVLATSSLRRKAQWLQKYPDHQVVSLRGNLQTRLRKLTDENDWDGAIFAEAGVNRIGLPVPHAFPLEWMLPAPGQGALAVVCREDDTQVLQAAAVTDHATTRASVTAERQFLRQLMGGCTMPIGALARVEGEEMHFSGNVLTLDGREEVRVDLVFPREKFEVAGQEAAELAFQKGAGTILEKLRGHGEP